MSEHVPELRSVSLDSPAWRWAPDGVRDAEFQGRSCITFGESVDLVALVDGVLVTDGVIEIDMALTGERAFHGVVWRARDRANYESFYVRPHQVHNPDSVQYNPTFNDVASWQLYHEDGAWAAVDFPIGAWFTVRVVFAGPRAEVFVGDMDRPALEVPELKMGGAAGGLGILIGGPGLLVSRFAYADSAMPFIGAGGAVAGPTPGVVPAWSVSDAFAEPEAPALELAPGALAGRSWTRLPAEPSGLANLAIVNAIRDARNTVFARTTIHADAALVAPMHVGFSDRAVVYLNGRALFHGSDGYRSRDYRFLGSIGWWDTVYLSLAAGDNDLVIAVSEDFGGWGLQARFDRLEGISFAEPA